MLAGIAEIVVTPGTPVKSGPNEIFTRPPATIADPLPGAVMSNCLQWLQNVTPCARDTAAKGHVASLMDTALTKIVVTLDAPVALCTSGWLVSCFTAVTDPPQAIHRCGRQ
mmetsp:Transcript_10702/g.33296  ORF Transcript_10702/g.33296 Transcript_10702/m.33296 type:complete len:111 (+) Transcript_10702:1645-1977(+)